MFCAQCGAQLKPGARFCATCGATVGAAGQEGGAGPYGAPPPGQEQWPGGGPAPGAGMGYGATAMTTEYADFGTRFVALLLDGLLLAVVGIFIALPLFLVFGVLGFLIFQVIPAGYFIYCFTQRDGQTVGGQVMGIKVVDANGALLTPSAAAIRWLVANAASIISFLLSGAGAGASALGTLLSLAQLVGYLMMLWDPKRQTVQDKAAGSYVIKVRR
jgi:uncharacterized RDD family membrane protein YckC